MSLLPKEKIPKMSVDPRRMVLYSKPKIGKSSLCAELPNSLLLDFEEGTDFLDAVKIKVKDYDHLRAICNEIIKEGRPYKYGIVDTITAVEEFALPLAKEMFRQTAMGANFGYKKDAKGINIKVDGKLVDDPKVKVTSLPNGAGYGYLREAFFEILDMIYKCFDHVILLGHFKDKLINKNSELISTSELDLTGKISSLVCAKVDAIGIIYRQDEYTNVVSFKNSGDTNVGNRANHLRGAEFTISEFNKEGKFITHWDKIFKDLNK